MDVDRESIADYTKHCDLRMMLQHLKVHLEFVSNDSDCLFASIVRCLEVNGIDTTVEKLRNDHLNDTRKISEHVQKNRHLSSASKYATRIKSGGYGDHFMIDQIARAHKVRILVIHAFHGRVTSFPKDEPEVEAVQVSATIYLLEYNYESHIRVYPLIPSHVTQTDASARRAQQRDATMDNGGADTGIDGGLDAGTDAGAAVDADVDEDGGTDAGPVAVTHSGTAADTDAAVYADGGTESVAAAEAAEYNEEDLEPLPIGQS